MSSQLAEDKDNELGEHHCREVVRSGGTITIAERQEAKNYGRDNEIRVQRRVLYNFATYGQDDTTLD